MSFYLSYTANIKLRKAKNVFFLEDGFLYVLKNKKKKELINLSKGIFENPIISVLAYIKSNNINDSEIFLPLLDEKLLDKACEAISNYLIDNDDSIGILTNNPNFRKDYSWLLNKYGITYSIPRPKPVFCTNGIIKKPKPRSTPNYRESNALEINGVLDAQFKTCAPRRPEPEDDLESGLILDEPFNTKFVKLLNESGKTSVEVYTKGGITRQVFSNILSKKDFIPRKDTVICLIIGMELNYVDGINLLACAGYALSRSIPQDVIVNKYLRRGIFDLNLINDELDERGCQLLGWKPREN